jgi:hypothetical protein
LLFSARGGEGTATKLRICSRWIWESERIDFRLGFWGEQNVSPQNIGDCCSKDDEAEAHAHNLSKAGHRFSKIKASCSSIPKRGLMVNH